MNGHRIWTIMVNRIAIYQRIGESMLVTFIGCPSSGKTTVAAMVFAELKKTGMPVEFVSERARLYIARKRMSNEKVILSDLDQLEIMDMQRNDEETMSMSNPKGIVISDSSSLNSLFYMTKNCRESELDNKAVRIRLDALYDPLTTLCYYCEPLLTDHPLDLNRIHSQAESLKIDGIIRTMLLLNTDGLKKYEPNLPAIVPFVKRLTGTPTMRTNDVLRDVYDRYVSQC